jgi:hypothetical protein
MDIKVPTKFGMFDTFNLIDVDMFQGRKGGDGLQMCARDKRGVAELCTVNRSRPSTYKQEITYASVRWNGYSPVGGEEKICVGNQ